MPDDVTAFANRLVPARADLAAAHLRGRVTAAAFADGRPARVTAPLADLFLSPSPDAGLATQLLHGEAFTVYEERDGLAWGQAELDGYVGYVGSADLGDPAAPTHRITALASHRYRRPEVKARVAGTLPFGAGVTVSAQANGFARTGELWVPEPHLGAVVMEAGPDAASVARRFLGAPYLWGGRSAQGLDCSALVQLAFLGVGRRVPRDSDMQEALLGAALPVDAAPARGDLVFWRGHVGILTDADTLLHANAHHMAVAEEPLAQAIARIAATETGPVTSRRRVAPG